MSVLLGGAGGSFGSATNFATGTNPKSVMTVDLNEDGNADLVTANQSSSSVSVLLGNGNGTFAAAVSTGVCTGAHEAVSGEFNADGNLDVAVACHGASNISVLLGNGSGGLGAAVSYGAGLAPHSIEAGEFTRDGHHGPRCRQLQRQLGEHPGRDRYRYVRGSRQLRGGLGPSLRPPR